jgi:hypothetical protein
MARLFGRQALTTGSPYNELDNDSGRKSHIGDASKTEKPTIFSFALKHLIVDRDENNRGSNTGGFSNDGFGYGGGVRS